MAMLTYLRGVHLVDGHNELPDTEGEGKKGVLASLAILGDTRLELTSTSRNDKDGTVSLGSTGDHVLDEVTVTRGVNDLENMVKYLERPRVSTENTHSDHEFGCLELPESNVDGDTTLTLSLQLVEHPGCSPRQSTAIGRVDYNSTHHI